MTLKRRFKVIDKMTGKEADPEEIALNEAWADGLIYCDMEGFAVGEYGRLFLLDECGRHEYAPSDRFEVVWDAEDIDVPTKWIPVEERLPVIIETKRAYQNVYRNSARVLCVCLQSDGKQMVKEGYCVFFNDNTEPYWRIAGTIHKVTHWMPMPEPPKGVE